MTKLLDQIAATLGPNGLLVGDDIDDRYRHAQFDIRRGEPEFVMRPANTGEVSKVLALCHDAGQPVTTQGGLTGLVDGAVPVAGEAVMNLERMRAVVDFDPASATLTVQSGIPLQTVQEFADDNGFLFPLDLGARGSCTVGGNLSTNAGGNRVVRYGMMRDLTLGVEAVLADGTVIPSLNTMMKNNSGYDLKHLFIGSEGTLGVITRAVLRLHPKPLSQSVAFCALSGFDAAIELLHHCHANLGGTLSAFEAVWPDTYKEVIAEVPTLRPPMPHEHPFYVLLESMGGDTAADAERFETTLVSAIEAGWVRDAVISKSVGEVADLWAVRDGIPEAMMKMQPMIGFDISMRIGDMGRLAKEIEAALDQAYPEHRTMFFGHIGDGNLHLTTFVGPDGADPEHQHAIDEIVYGIVGEASGSISAEHGIGLLKRDYLHHSRTPEEIALMRTLKGALDPKNILNPGRIFPVAG